MSDKISRNDFLKLGGLGLGSSMLGVSPFGNEAGPRRPTAYFYADQPATNLPELPDIQLRTQNLKENN